MVTLGMISPLRLSTFSKHKTFPAFTPLRSHAQLNSENNYPSFLYVPKLHKAVPESANSYQCGNVELENELHDDQVEEGGRLMKANQLPKGLERKLIPNHIGLIMDGNRRWAKERGFSTSLGHVAGQKAMKGIVTLCSNWGIKVVTVFAFSTENWSRPKNEVEFLWKFFEDALNQDTPELAKEGVRISVIGNRQMLPKSVQEGIAKAEETTKANSKTHLIVAVNYSGKYDIIQASKSIAEKVKSGLIQSEDILNDQSLFEQELLTSQTAEFPCPDLMIRTSGECRTSNFMLWQLAYSELFFVDKMFPDFGEAEFIEVLTSFQERKGAK